VHGLSRNGRDFDHLAAALALTFGGRTVAAEVVAVVSAKNPVAALSKEQVVDIFLGKASRFPDGSPTVPIDLAEGSAAREEFYAKFAGKSSAQLKAHWSKIIFTGRGQPPREALNSAEMKKLIVENPYVIGYLDQSLVDTSVKVIPAP
jgi:ABC-type phosphate transport system substrate-binding protein